MFCRLPVSLCLSAAGLLLAAAAPEARSQFSTNVSFTRNVDDYGAVGDGLADDARAIQAAVSAGYDGRWHNYSRIMFSAGKSYRIAHRIILWGGVHLDTNPTNPATILLAGATPGFGDTNAVRHMFMSRLAAARVTCPGNTNAAPLYWPWRWPEDYESAVLDESLIDGNYGYGNNFFSQIRNLKFRIEPGNPGAAALHYVNAQGTYLYNLRFDLSDDAAYAVAGGPFIANCTFKGGRYGMFEPQGMEFGMVVNSSFSGQKQAAYFQGAISPARIWVGTTFEDLPLAMRLNCPRSVTMIGCSISRAGTGVSLVNPYTEVLIQNLRGVQVTNLFHSPRTSVPGNPKGSATLPTFVQGDVMDNGRWIDGGGILPTSLALPLPNMAPVDPAGAANVKTCGALGDGTHDDTAAFRAAVASNDVVFVPAGNYRLTDTLLLRRKTKLIGEHGGAVNLFLLPSTPGFTNPNNPKPILDTPDDPEGDVQITQIGMGMTTWGPEANPGAIGLRWRVGRKSSLAHTCINAGAIGMLVTGHGGGTFINNWTAWAGATRGVVVDHNQEPLVAYMIDAEHQTDKAIQLLGARDVTFYFGGGGEGNYPSNQIMNEIVDSERIAWVYCAAHPCPDPDTPSMTLLRIRNSTNLWIGPLIRCHTEALRHTVLDTRPDGSVVDCGNRGFTLYQANQKGAVPPETTEGVRELVRWGFDEGSGTNTADLSGHGWTLGMFRHCGDGLAPASASLWGPLGDTPSGKGHALQLNGVNQYATPEPGAGSNLWRFAAASGITNFSFSAWIKSRSPQNSTTTVLAHGDNVAANAGWAWYDVKYIDRSQDNLSFLFQAGSSPRWTGQVFASAQDWSNAWAHVVLTFQVNTTNRTTTIRTYHNGLELTRAQSQYTNNLPGWEPVFGPLPFSGPLVEDAWQQLYVGATGRNDTNVRKLFFSGLMDEVRFFDGVLDQRRIDLLYRNPGVPGKEIELGVRPWTNGVCLDRSIVRRVAFFGAWDGRPARLRSGRARCPSHGSAMNDRMTKRERRGVGRASRPSPEWTGKMPVPRFGNE